MRLGKGLMAGVRSSFQLKRLANALSDKPVRYQSELFSDHYHKQYCRYERAADGSYLVESKDKGLFGVRGGLPNFILDWLKLSFHRANEAFFSFLSYFEQRFVELRHAKAEMTSVVYRAEQTQSTQDQQVLLNQYFASMNFDHCDYNTAPVTLLNKHSGRSLNTIHRMLGLYFPYKFEISTDNIEWKVIPMAARSQLGQTQIGRGTVLGHKYPQLSHKVTVTIKVSDADQFQQFSVTGSTAAKHLEQIKEFCRQCFSEHASVDVIAQYHGRRVSPTSLTKKNTNAVVLGNNAQLLTTQKNQLQQIRKH
ncbi:type VI secretion system baseplate subunit TssG [Thalassotalea euphylliae]|uniref:Uncharacterized protein n=1 Tax=Thalassotalea euphylliae TaxID=1655234 RepID=A0A3E0U1Y2_9GAMM|nr:type VI secretion system baseplate subunit TssG [Thalassotalea euphylliae]REL30710.1 hypothetical protein DXX94_08270 [Thalassotalea euphylliae]